MVLFIKAKPFGSHYQITCSMFKLMTHFCFILYTLVDRTCKQSQHSLFANLTYFFLWWINIIVTNVKLS